MSVCSDCKNVSRDARQKDRSAPDGYLSLVDIQGALQEVRPHSEHLVDYALVREKMLANQPYDSAYEAYSAYQSLVRKLAGVMQYRIERLVPREAIIAEFCEILHFEHDIESPEEQDDFVEWLLARKMLDDD